MKFVGRWLFVAASCWLAEGGSREACITKDEVGRLTALLWMFHINETDASIFNKHTVHHDKQMDSDKRWPTLPVMKPRLEYVIQIDKHFRCQTEDHRRRHKRAATKHGRHYQARQRTSTGVRAFVRPAKRRLQRMMTAAMALYRKAFGQLTPTTPSRRTKRFAATEKEEDMARKQAVESGRGTLQDLSCRLASLENSLKTFRRELQKKLRFDREVQEGLSGQLKLLERLVNVVKRAFPLGGKLRSGRKQPFRDRCQQYQTLDYDPDRYPSFIYRVECCSNRIPGLQMYNCDQQFVYKKVLRPVNGCYKGVLEPVPVRCHFTPGKSES